MKVIICTPNYNCSQQFFALDFVEVLQKVHTLRFLKIQSGAPADVLISPNAITSSSLELQRQNNYPSSSTSCNNFFCIWHTPCIMQLSWQFLEFCMDSINLRLVVIIHHKCMHLISHFTQVWQAPGCFFTSFLSLPSHMLLRSQLLAAVYMYDSSKEPAAFSGSCFKHSFRDQLSHLHFTMNSANTKQSPPHSGLYSSALTISSANMTKKVNHTTAEFMYCRYTVS